MRLLSRLLVIVLAGGGAGACSNGTANDANDGGVQCSGVTGTATVSGTMQGATLLAKDAVVTKSGGSTVVAITDFADACALGNSFKKNSSVVSFDFYGATLTPGTIQVGSNLSVQYAAYDQSCNSPNGESATAGSVTITGVSGCAVSGAFDVNFGSDHITGSFKAAACAATGGSGGATCQ